MHKDSFDFVYNAEGDYYDLVVDKKIQKVVEELKALPHEVQLKTCLPSVLSSKGLRVSREAHSDRYLSIILL